MQTIRVGAAGLHFPNFEALKHGIWEKSCARLEEKSQDLHIEFFIWPELIDQAAEAERAAAFFGDSRVDFLLLQASSFFLGDVLVPFLESGCCSRIGFWFMEEPVPTGELQLNSLTGFNLAVSFVRRYADTIGFKWFFGYPGDSAFDEAFSITIGALRAVTALSNARIGQVGAVVPGFDNLFYDSEIIANSLGAEVVPVPLDELFDRCRTAQAAAVGGTVAELKGKAAAVLVEDSWLEKSARVIVGLQELKEKYRLDAAAVRCWPEFQAELNFAPCAALAFSTDAGFAAGCEGDLIGTLSMFAASRITGTAATINDPVALDPVAEAIQMWHCGPGPASWADQEGQVLNYHHTLDRRSGDGDAKTGVSSDMSFRQGPVTVMRFLEHGSKVFVFEAEIVDHPSRPYAGSGGWFGRFRSDGEPVTVRDLIETVAVYGIEHHYPVCRGHIEPVFREMAAWMGLEVVPFRRWKPYKQ